jgi:hypothetical protein
MIDTELFNRFLKGEVRIASINWNESYLYFDLNEREVKEEDGTPYDISLNELLSGNIQFIEYVEPEQHKIITKAQLLEMLEEAYSYGTSDGCSDDDKFENELREMVEEFFNK